MDEVSLLTFDTLTFWIKGGPHGGNDSIMPCLALKGVANGIARSRSLRAKVLLRKSACGVEIPFVTV